MASTAPKERINVTYQPATGDIEGGVELPLKILMVGDYTGREDPTPVEDRKAINVNAVNFEDVLREQKIEITVNVKNRLSDEGGELPVQLKINSMKDYGPEGIANQVPELKQLLELRKALSALKGPMGNFPKFKKRIQALLEDQGARDALLKELGIEDADESKGG